MRFVLAGWCLDVLPPLKVASASLGAATAASNAVALTIDGNDVTAQAAFDGRTITYVPKSGLPQGRHTAEFSGRTSTGQPFSTQWTFITTAPAMDSDLQYAYGDYRFYAGPAYPYGGGSVMNFTLIGPPTGSGFVQIWSPNFIYPLWNGGGQCTGRASFCRVHTSSGRAPSRRFSSAGTGTVCTFRSSR